MREKIFEKIVMYAVEIIGDIEKDNIKEEDSLKDLGANSIDRSEIIISVLYDFELKISMIKFAECKNIADIIDVIVQTLELKV